MRLTPLGAREVFISAVIFCLGSIVLISLYRSENNFWYLLPIVPLAVIFVWVLCFFRDPPRRIPDAPGLILSPADGTITHLDEVDEPEFIEGTARRCSIFLSIFNVHLNRAPAAGKAVFVKFRPGAFFDARREESLTKNQNQDVGIIPSETVMPGKMLIRQSTGAIARRIICPVKVGMSLRKGEKYGMIKFGSRTTLFLSKDARVEWLVAVGDRVKAGETILAVVRDASSEDSERGSQHGDPQ